ncbi:XRE family transcriptional regulator [Vibrio anguillarum]|nr:XRE family transcriptional regulator [Vibrio anguillarum]MBF4277341.1 XRE family transcriptional regulator [Vibrio anguillarum]MBF4300097.1 XRE family transcriptional regulator [Vibrio anguillarum]MBF4362056.1 XRE family transcriptional regulator [Vibrio anguillarum]MBF4397763.1 XRE family transcriptional regulator [Vibrio anguillarum]
MSLCTPPIKVITKRGWTMVFSEEDRQALYNVWMTQKAKMHLTQMEMAKRLNLTQLEFSHLLRGDSSLSMTFISQFCRHLHIEPHRVLPSLKQTATSEVKAICLKNRISVDGDIQHVSIEGNQVIIEYIHYA